MSNTIYVLVKTETGEAIVGGGSSTTPHIRGYQTLAAAKRGRNGMGIHGTTYDAGSRMHIVQLDLDSGRIVG